MKKHQNTLTTPSNKREELYLRILYGTKAIIRQKWKILFPLLYLSILGVMAKIIYWFCHQQSNAFTSLWEIVTYLLPIMFISLTLSGIISILSLLGTPWGTKKIQNEFLRIGLTNSKGEAPLLLAKYKSNQLIIMEFACRGISFDLWEKKFAKSKTFLKYKILKIKAGKSPKYISLYTTSPKNSLPAKLKWNDTYLILNGFNLVLGKNEYETVSINLSSGHLLIGGSTGSGKSVLLKVLLMQCLKKNASVFIVDFKGGVDYAPIWRKKCSLLYSESELLAVLSELINTLETRKELFRECGCCNIDVYNSQSTEKLQRIILAFDEVAEALDKTGLSKEHKEQISLIESRLNTIARLGRAFGIHLILATQRPSADVISGQIKSNISHRVCGIADAVLSDIILDTTDAATTIPKDSHGHFLTNTGEYFQGFWLDDKDLE